MTVLCLAAMWLAGFGLVRRIFPSPLGWSLHNIFLFSLGIGTGAGVASCLYFLALLLAGPGLAPLAAVLSVFVIVALVVGLLAKPQGTPLQWADGPQVPRYLFLLFALAAALAVAMFFGAITFSPHGEEGAWSIWNLKARFLFRAGPFWRDAFSRDLGWTHLDYPLLLPGLVAMCWKLVGGESTDAPIAIAFLFGLGACALLVSSLGILRGKTQALLAGIVLLGTATFVALDAALYGDVPLSFYILATLALLCLQDRHPDNLRFSLLAGLMAGFGAWTRNEGLIFAIVVVAARAFSLFRFREPGAATSPASQLVQFAAGLAAPLALVVFFKLAVGGPSELASLPAVQILNHAADFGRWVTTLEGVVVLLWGLGGFLLPVVLALVLFWYLVRLRVDARDRASLATICFSLALTFAVQLLIDLFYVDNLPLEVTTAYERVLLQLWPAALLAFFLASGPLQLLPPPAAPKGKTVKRSSRSARSVAETR